MYPELQYVAVLVGLFVVPTILQRFRLPTAVTSLLLGIGAGAAGWLREDPTLELLSVFGIVALFLFAGLEIDGGDLRRGFWVLLILLALQAGVLAAVAFGARRALDLPFQSALLLALALLTPSCGFILDSLPAFGFSEKARFWVRSKAIASEVLALGALFVTLQSDSLLRVAGGTLVLVALIIVVPLLFRLFARGIAPYAPRTEFAFLLLLAVLCAQVTRRLGVYYLVGAFLVGVAAQGFRSSLPSVSSGKVLHALEAFGSIFIPFYFFHAGMGISLEAFSPRALLTGGAFLLFLLPLRLALVALHQRVALRQSLDQGLKVGAALLPTLVFSLVLAEILRDRFAIPAPLFGGIILYALANTLVPGFLFQVPLPRYDAPELVEAPAAEETAAPPSPP
ncbi:MAG: cation:proton antiporter [Acidobacteria bacterium]|nr:cation:proton antiporter [Acidobacteriota bacterium]